MHFKKGGGSIGQPGSVAYGFTRMGVFRILAEGADVIYHLAAVLSGQSEAEFDLGMRVNLHGSINVFEAARGL